MSSEATSARIPRGLMFTVLQTIGYLGLDAYGARIREIVSQKTGKELLASQIYVTCARLESQGLVTSSEEERVQGRRGQLRRIYKLTVEGHQSLEAASKFYGTSVSSIAGDSRREKEGKTSPAATLG
jgi:DNA-binding PadR family transcriptional regulator